MTVFTYTTQIQGTLDPMLAWGVFIKDNPANGEKGYSGTVNVYRDEIRSWSAHDAVPVQMEIISIAAIQKAFKDADAKFNFHGGRLVYENSLLGLYIYEMDVEVPDPQTTGVPTSPFQTLLDKAGLDSTDSEVYQGVNECAINLAIDLTDKTDPEDLDALGDKISYDLQTCLIEVGLRVGYRRFQRLANLVAAARVI